MFTDLAQIFNLTFNPFALLSLLAVVVNISLIILIQVRGSRNEANRWFVLLLIALVVWGIAEFFGRLSTTAEASSFWGYVGRPGWIFVSVVFFSFVLTYIGKENILESRFARFLIYGPGLIFLFLSWNTNLISNNDISTSFKVPWGWDDSTVAAYWWVFVVWLESFFITSVYLLTRFYFKLTDEVRKKQTLLIIVAVLIPIIGGSLTDAILPIFNIQVVPIAILLTSVMSIIVTYATVRFRLFAISPSLTAKTIVDTMSEALVVVSPTHEIEQVNKATLDLLGFKDDELVGKSIRRIIPDVANWEHFLKRVVVPLKEKTFVKGCEVDFRTKDGKTIPVSFSATSLVEEGKLLGIVGLSRDIRETRKLINRLTAERNKINVTMNGIVDGVFAVDKKGKIILFNPAMERMLRVGQDQVLGKYADDVVFMSEKDTKVSVFELLPKKRVHEDQVVTKKKKVKIVGRDGTNVYVELTSSTITENEEIDLGAIITLHDISKEHELEEMKLDFVSMAAHELRTPLTSIRGYLSVLQDELKEKVSKEEMSFLQKAFISSSQLASLVENLLSVSRIERGRMKIEKSSVDWV
jgi:PAS domain S-box-containing protein